MTVTTFDLRGVAMTEGRRRLRDWMAGLGLEEAARRLAIKKSTLCALKNGDSQMPTTPVANRIKKICAIQTEDWEISATSTSHSTRVNEAGPTFEEDDDAERDGAA